MKNEFFYRHIAKFYFFFTAAYFRLFMPSASYIIRDMIARGIL